MTPRDPAPEALIGQTLGGAYRVLSRLDEGGMGTVYEAEHVRLRRRVAVKVMAAHLSVDESALARFEREAEIISQLHHPNIVQVLDFDTTPDGQPFLVMELLKGRSLDSVLSRHGKLEIGQALRISLQAASALSAAHAAGVIHRDLKPANIYLVDAGEQLFVKLLDFGISKRAEANSTHRKLTGEFDILGTPDYMPPEQAIGKTAQVDHRGDQYALAVIAYEMLTGKVPFSGSDVIELLQRVVRAPPVAPQAIRPEIPDKVNEALLRALQKVPELRFDSIHEFAEVLELSMAEVALGSSPNLRRTTDPFRRRIPSDGIGESLTPAPPNTATPPDATIPTGSAKTEYASPSRPRRLSPNAGRYSSPEKPAPEASLGPAADASKSARKSPTSWHSKDPAKACRELIERARQEMGLDNLDLAVSCAESALDISQQSSHPEAKEAVQNSAEFFQRVFERRLGDLKSMINVRPEAHLEQHLTPEQAFLLSRIDGGLSVEEALDLSPLSRELTLGHLVGLIRLGHIELGSRRT